MLKWTASAFATAAAMQFGLASAQETSDPVLASPGPADVEAGADTANNGTAPSQNASDSDSALQNAADLPDATRNLQNSGDATQREARFAPSGDDAQLSDHIRSATSNLNIDDATRSRYRWHNGEWWFKTKSGQWKFYRDGKWQDFDPTTYRSPGGMAGSGSGNYVPQGDTNYAQPQQFSSSSGYFYQNRPYSSTRYGAFRPTYGGYNNGWNNNGGWNNNSGWNNSYNGSGYNNGYGFNNGYGTGYNPGNDRYYGAGPYGQPYSISGNQYRGGMLGSQIGGQLGGNTGAIIGGAIGARAAK